MKDLFSPTVLRKYTWGHFVKNSQYIMLIPAWPLHSPSQLSQQPCLTLIHRLLRLSLFTLSDKVVGLTIGTFPSGCETAQIENARKKLENWPSRVKHVNSKNKKNKGCMFTGSGHSQQEHSEDTWHSIQWCLNRCKAPFPGGATVWMLKWLWVSLPVRPWK